MRYNLFASKRYCLYNRTAKTTVQLQHLENVKVIKNQFTIETTMDNITLMTVKEMKNDQQKIAAVNNKKTL